MAIGGIGAGIGGTYSAPTGTARNSGAAKAVDDFNATVGVTQSDRLKALKFSQMGLKDQDHQAVDPKQQQMQKLMQDKAREAAHQASDPTKVGLVLDIKA